MKKVQPTLRFPEFNGDWELNILGKLANISSGGTPNRSNENYWNGNIPWVSTTLIDFNIINSTDEKITLEGLNNSSAKIFPQGTLLMALYGQGKTRGKISILGIDAATNQACGAIIPDEAIINNKFLFQNLASRYDEIRDLSNQGGQENLSGGILKSIEIFYPSLQEQTKIANFLSAVDQKISLLQQQKELLETYKKGVMQKIFNQELRFTQNNGSSFPDWEEKSLGDVLIKNSRKNKLSKITYVESISNKYGFVSQEQYFDSSNIASKNLENYYVISKGFFAYNPSRIDVGSLAYKFNDIDSVISPLYISFKTKDTIDDFFLLNYFETMRFKNQMKSSFEGSVRNTLSYDSLIKIKIDLPSLEEQTKIAEFLSAIDHKISLVNQQLAHTQTYKKGLLQQLFV